MTINAPAAILLAFYVATAEEQGVPPERLGGTIQTDILKEYIAQKEWCFPIEPAMRLVEDMIEWCTEHMPRWHPISISGYHIREAGSTAQQELAFTLKDGFTYVRGGDRARPGRRRLRPAALASSSTRTSTSSRRSPSTGPRAASGPGRCERPSAPSEQESWRMRFHTQTAGVSLTAQQPQNNIVRTAIEALAGVLGGTQSLHTNSYDEALALPTEEAVRIALRTQQVIAHETGVTNTIDPLGGSYFVETLTDEMERAAYEYFARIDELGGMVEAIKQNFPQREIADASFRYQQEVDSKQRIVVGVNDHMLAGDEEIPILRIDPELERKQKERVEATKARRDSAEVERTLGELKAAAATDANLMPPILACARARVSEGEMVEALQQVFGSYTELPVF